MKSPWNAQVLKRISLKSIRSVLPAVSTDAVRSLEDLERPPCKAAWATKIQLEDEAWRISGEAYEYIYIYIGLLWVIYIYIYNIMYIYNIYIYIGLLWVIYNIICIYIYTLLYICICICMYVYIIGYIKTDVSSQTREIARVWRYRV